MKTVNIAYIGMAWKFDYKQDFIYKTLQKYYNVIVHENINDADYLICSVFGVPYEYCRYDKIRIFYSNENYIPDFNLVDYGISSYSLSLQDRHLCLPQCIDRFGRFSKLGMIDRTNPKKILESKRYFANFIAGHESEFSIRGDFFKKLCEYKRVESAGTYLNNMENSFVVKWEDNSKFDFQTSCKFTLCFESTKNEGFVTEKITDAFLANTIPIYYGSDSIKDIFNEQAFIHCSDYASFDAVIEKIKELDQDDKKYMEMISQPILKDADFYQNAMQSLEDFLCNIFNQPIQQAYRRSRIYWPKKMENYLLYRKDNARIIEEYSIKSMIKEIGKRISQKFKRRH